MTEAISADGEDGKDRCKGVGQLRGDSQMASRAWPSIIFPSVDDV
jgi:hypothetical protein